MKKLLIIALALMLALSLVACNNKDGNEDQTGGGIILDPNGTNNGTTAGDPSTDPGNNNGNTDTPVVEEVFTDLEQTIFITADVASVRSEARKADDTLIAYAAKNAEFKSTGYSENWYRIEYEIAVEQTTEAETEADAAPASEETTVETEADTTVDTEATTEAETEAAPTTEIVVAYVHKSVAFIKDMTAVELEEPLTLYVIAYALNVRSYYDFASANNVMCTLQQGDEVVALEKGNGWYKIQLANDAEGNAQFGYISANESYVSTTKPEQTTEAAE